MICQFVAWILIANGLTRTDPMKVGLILLLQPTCAFIWDIVLFHLPITPASITGVIMTLVAIYLGILGGTGKKKRTIMDNPFIDKNSW